MFRTNNCSSPEVLYKQLTVFNHASSRWHDTIYTVSYLYRTPDDEQLFVCKYVEDNLSEINY
jgi:hypothetical protein